jgi:hypothetical protein
MTELDRKIEQLRRLLYATHYENYDFIYLPAADALTIVRLLDYRRSKNAEANRRKNELSQMR